MRNHLDRLKRAPDDRRLRGNIDAVRHRLVASVNVAKHVFNRRKLL